MAGSAYPRRTRKHRVDVAAFAGLQPVRAGQLESGGEVVEVAPGHLG